MACGAVLMMALAAGCRNTGPPTIVRVEGPVEVSSGDTAAYECQAWDWDSEPIRFYWTASRGEVFEQGDEPTRSMSYVRWAGPESAGPAVVRVAVVDLDSMVTRDSISVNVRVKSRTVLSADGLLKSGHTRTWSDSLSHGHRLSGWFDVDTGRVSFRLLDTSSYRRWAAGDSYEPLYEAVQVREDSLRLGVPSSGRHYIVLDNRSGKLDQQFRVRLTAVTP